MSQHNHTKLPLDRRLFMGGLAALGGATLARPGLAQSGRPELVIGISGLPTSMMPGRISNTHNRLKMVYLDQLIARDYNATPEGNGFDIVPWLAESWSQIEPTVWEFKLRPGVKFHDGTEMTAEDVAFSFGEGRMWGENPSEPQGERYFNGGLIAGIDVVDPLTVRIRTNAPDLIMPLRFVSPVGFVVPKAYYEKVGPDEFFLNPVGTGPYKMTRLERDTLIEFEAFDDYWGGKPPASKITFRVVPEMSSRVAGLLSGEFDIITDVEPELVSTVESHDELKVRKVNYENQVVIVISTLHPVTSDKRIRQALVHALDREAMAKALWGDATHVPEPFAFEFYGEYYDPDRRGRKYDMEKAKELLESAGYNGEVLNLRIQRGGYPKIEDAAQIMAEMWKKAGINVEIEIRKGSALAAEGLPDGEVAMISWSNGIHIPDPATPIWATWGPDGPRAPGKKESSWDHPQSFIDVGRAFEVESDPEKRRELFKQLVDIWVEETPGFPLWMRADWFAMKKEIEWTPYSFFYLDFGPDNLSFST
ncbi:ABC transporter substrate-binding protein [Frigidibacter sp. ROC022]|uniref:ABC transporter substrate-binding protein n=1 Tax=Frigidibacter sp. ROC022 TaxID=2971796 RepID=UPI00215A3B28|nr:ABC transporter substrate-binding protein [Frigidibacter sp. ROC022]MCR8723899.1 ABC transporter substrate-binding protein [Frigidibacter sp. ROC022]